MTSVIQTLKPIDDRQEPDQDSYETPPKLFHYLCDLYGYQPLLDAAAKPYNTKCQFFLFNALHQEWTIGDNTPEIVDVWCNPPHSKTEEFVRRAEAQHKKYGMGIIMIIPANTISAQFYHDVIEDEKTVKVENHPILKRPRFLKLGRKTKQSSRNAYQVILWRKK